MVAMEFKQTEKPLQVFLNVFVTCHFVHGGRSRRGEYWREAGAQPVRAGHKGVARTGGETR